jgi:hypothetical protein
VSSILFDTHIQDSYEGKSIVPRCTLELKLCDKKEEEDTNNKSKLVQFTRFIRALESHIIQLLNESTNPSKKLCIAVLENSSLVKSSNKNPKFGEQVIVYKLFRMYI